MRLWVYAWVGLAVAACTGGQDDAPPTVGLVGAGSGAVGSADPGTPVPQAGVQASPPAMGNGSQGGAGSPNAGAPEPPAPAEVPGGAGTPPAPVDVVDAGVGMPPDAATEPEVPSRLASGFVLPPETAAQFVSGGDAQLIDARDGASFATRHAAGALSLPGASLRTTVDGVSNQVPAAVDAARIVGAAGIDPDLPAIVYGDSSDLTASRLVWTLLWMGHREVYLLDGGLNAWRAAGLEVASGGAGTTAGSYPSDRVDELTIVDTAFVEASLNDPDVFFVDARPALEYALGNIPGAVNLPWSNNVSGGALRSEAELTERHRDVPRSGTVVVYCLIGMRASMAWLVLKQLGFEDVRLYDGSWVAWTQDSSRPVE